MNTCTQILSLWAPLKDWTGRSGDFRSHHWRLVVDGNVAYHLTHNAGKFWNKSRKVRAPVPSRGLEPGWIGSTTRDLTNWSMISSQQIISWHSNSSMPDRAGPPTRRLRARGPIYLDRTCPARPAAPTTWLIGVIKLLLLYYSLLPNAHAYQNSNFTIFDE